MVYKSGGSSPLARGTCARCSGTTAEARLIPARAGNIRPARGSRRGTTAHPRSRGEHVAVMVAFMVVSGSSPLARGTFEKYSVGRYSSRLIPARAGNISCAMSAIIRRPAHPRSRGEHSKNLTAPARIDGSSPLARGTSMSELTTAPRFRLIPARAGNIYQGWRWNNGEPAHPRSRGEHDTDGDEGFIGDGSSPLARGTYGRVLVSQLAKRLIPARAGNILADMGVYPLHQQNRITLKPEPHPGYTINSHS